MSLVVPDLLLLRLEAPSLTVEILLSYSPDDVFDKFFVNACISEVKSSDY